MTTLVLLALCVLVLAALLAPLRRGREEPMKQGSRVKIGGGAKAPLDSANAADRSAGADPKGRALLDEKDRLLQAIAELRFDFEAGKLSPEDFEREDARLRERTAVIIRELDASS